ncbi:MAG: hypothetical protein HZA51_09540 [Planctomycetes bacterium]|nr:hypothetical protein [Planctomycetota bacterium]
MIARRTLIAVLSLSVFASAFAVVRAEAPSADLYKAYFLERESRDYVAARKLYQSALRQDLSADAKRAAKAGADRCRDHLAAQNFATLMPPDAVVYADITRPGEILEKLCGMLGLTTNDMQSILSQRPSAEAKGPIHVPSHVAISPAVFEYLRAFGGAGVALTNFDPEGGKAPTGVMVIHHGDVALLKGLLETAFQFAPTAEKIGDLPTFGAELPEVGKVCGVLTECLLVVGTGRDMVEGVVARLTSDAPSLASRDDLQELMKQRTGATLFAFCDIQGVLKIAKATMSEGDRREFDVANGIADLDSFRWASFSMGIHEGTLGAQLAVRLADDHRSIAYNLMRLPPMTRKCLESVPENAAGFIGLGLNPALVNAAVDTARKNQTGKQGVTGFDIGREFFGNIQELCAFVVPGEGKSGDGGHIPSGGIVLAVNDPARSKALWDQLLSIPGIVHGHEPVRPEPTKIGETEATAYALPTVGKVYLAEMDGCVVLTSTRPAMKACVAARTRQKNILHDEIMGKVIEKMPKDSSIMIAVHAGRAMEAGAAQGNPGMAMAAGQTKQMASKTVLWAGLGQSPNEMTLRVSVAGLPNVNDALRTYGPMINTFANMAIQKSQTKNDSRIAHRQVSRKPAPKHEDDEESEDSEDRKPTLD